MRIRTPQEILKLALEYEVERMWQIGGDETESLYASLIRNLEGDEQPEGHLKYGSVWGWDFKESSITEKEFEEFVVEPVEKLIRERNQSRDASIYRMSELLMKRKEEGR